ncbi:plasma membrane calcium-transporting ATPase putative [Entamoeba histolytica]|uniref:Plasma membrane calcium-transporting ATPase, putative n=2 Tax=Entamoeba histolytica TaxID=5759 RepID=B1N3C3_ENTH1|nr:plasma membrane calcium-transporting ATPase, putative [Entamoeba histolytica HM-1:IMSS]EDS89537.1 plasma membrane calcium-transporting ATPase, putative [Entamoeba histolytica HM-1:IMSS]GAT95090.1 plasma membrane calcium-transporting ATPase putative [Entamoeba histolytica]|eukprot:XP_001913689.1 plasma membrane calcium-transporting ATPase, putative [Entamoeba histolytica HM-1:IMSS]
MTESKEKPEIGHVDSTIHYNIKGNELIDIIEHRNNEKYQRLGGIHGLCELLNVDEKKGIALNSITKRVQQFGNNLLPPAERQKCSSNIDTEPPDYYEGIAILVAVFAVSLIGAWNDYSKQSKFIEIASKETDCSVKIIRDGVPMESTSSQLVVGDIVYLSVGDVLPADGIYLKGNGLRIDESEMTGESASVKKSEDNFVCLSGCTVTDGNGTMLKGYVNKDKQRPTPLQERLDELAENIGKMGMFCAAIVFIVLTLWWFYKAITFTGYVQPDDHCKLCSPTETTNCVAAKFNWWRITDLVDYFIIAVTIVVVAVPEGLPLAVTVS